MAFSLAQAFVLAAQVDHFMHAFNEAGCRRGRAGNRIQDRCEGAGHPVPHAFHQDGVDLADHHQSDGRQYE